METLSQRLAAQRLANDYQLVNGVQMHAEHGQQFQIPPAVIKRHVAVGHFVELRIDSPRFSVHQDAAVKCYCPSCHGEATKPIIGHQEPASLVPLPRQEVPSRGWGEDFWVRVTECNDAYFAGVVDNPLYEARLHGLRQGDTLFFHQDHILAVHGSHRQELVLSMDAADLKLLANYLAGQSQ